MTITPELIAFICSILGLLGFIYRISGKYHISISRLDNIEKSIILMGTLNQKVLTLEHNYLNLSNHTVTKMDAARTEAEIDNLKSNMNDIKTALQDFMKATAVQYQEINNYVIKINGQYLEIKSILSKNVLQ